MNNFKNLNVSDYLISRLHNNYIKIPTKIQQKAIPMIYEGEDLIVKASTGSGKTLSFLLPILDKMEYNTLETVIISPTRELARQITNEILKINEDIKVLSIYGGVDINKQFSKLKNDIHIVVATPGRLIDHINRNTIDISTTKYFILDEVDNLMNMGFKEDILYINNYLKKPQVLTFSATVDKNIKKTVANLTDNFIFISEDNDVKDRIEQRIIMTKPRKKYEDLINYLEEENPFLAIIFCRTKRRVNELEFKLKTDGYNVDKIHSDIPQNKRNRVIKNFKDLKLQYLVSTELISRGIDINGISHIINYDMPEKNDNYIHRIGRSGRYNDTGKTIMLVNEEELDALKNLEEHLGYKLDEYKK